MPARLSVHMERIAASTAAFAARVFLQGRADHPGAQALGQNQPVARLRAHILQHALRINDAGHRVAEFDFVVANGVAANHRAAGFLHLGKAALKNLFENFDIPAGVGEPDDGERGNRPATHGIHIAQRVGGGNLAEGVRVIHDGREEIHGLDQRQLGRELIHSRVVGGVKAYQHVRVELFRQPGEHRVQNPWTQLGRSTRRLDHRGQPCAFVHSVFDYMLPPDDSQS